MGTQGRGTDSIFGVVSEEQQLSGSQFRFKTVCITDTDRDVRCAERLPQEAQCDWADSEWHGNVVEWWSRAGTEARDHILGLESRRRSKVHGVKQCKLCSLRACGFAISVVVCLRRLRWVI